MTERDVLAARVAELIDALADGGRDDRARDALLCDVARFQARNVEPFARLLRARSIDPDPLCHPEDIPGLPTDVFRFTRVASHSPFEDVRVFRTSGTTTRARGMHSFRDLSLYDHAARTAARHALFPDVERIRLVMLAPHEDEAEDSSLSYMLTRFEAWFGMEPATWVVRSGKLDVEALEHALRRAEKDGTPIALAGTSFAFVHAEDALANARFRLPPGSRLMQTGGFKGRSRAVDPERLRAMLAARFGIPEPFVVAEYGMTELSSQMYEQALRDAVDGRDRKRRALIVPGWVRAVVLDPERLTPVPPGEIGILRIDDVANLDSVAFVQTADLARQTDEGIALVGRAPGAIPRGCSIAADEALGTESP